jgi:molybdate transport system permease protein
MFDSNDLFAVALSLKAACAATLINVIIGIPIAYILARKDFFLKSLVDTIITLPLVLPPTVVGFYLLFIFGRNGFIGGFLHDTFGVTIVFTWYAAALASQIVSMPLMVRAAKAAISSVDKEYEDVSYTLGRSKVYTLLRVTLPLAKRGIIAGIVLTFCRALGEFGATIMVAGNIPGRTTTMPVAIYSSFYSSQDYKLYFFVAILTVISFAATFIVNRMEKKWEKKRARAV